MALPPQTIVGVVVSARAASGRAVLESGAGVDAAMPHLGGSPRGTVSRYPTRKNERSRAYRAV